MIQRFVTTLFAVGAVFCVACIDMSAPKGAASISLLQLAAPFVVVGDTLRDSAGAVVPLKILAFDAANNPIPDVPSQFFLTDTTTAAHITPLNVVVGDKIGTVHLVGQVGSLQTPIVNLPVTFRPFAIVAGAKALDDTARFDFLADSSGSYGTSSVSARVRSTQDSNSVGVVVHFKIVLAPAMKAGATPPGVFIADDNNKPMAIDTTDPSGVVTRRLAVFPRSIIDGALLEGSKVDSAIVEISASYKGVPLANSPLRITVPIKAK